MGWAGLESIRLIGYIRTTPGLKDKKIFTRARSNSSLNYHYSYLLCFCGNGELVARIR